MMNADQEKEAVEMGVDLRMEPYAKEFEKERPGLRIIDEFCFQDIDRLFARLGLNWDYREGPLPHDDALRILAAVEPHKVAAEKLLILLHLYRYWYEHPENIPAQMQQFVGTMPRMAGVVKNWSAEKQRPRLVLV